MEKTATGLSFSVKIMVKLCLVMGLFGTCKVAQSQENVQVPWKQILQQPANWYGTEEAIRIADNVLLYQNKNGGWLKNIDMSPELNEDQKSQLLKDKSNKTGTTIDNNATFTQIELLARVYKQSSEERFKDGALKGLDYVMEAQYDNGGWPQYYPVREGYYEHITFNDGAMIQAMGLLKDVSLGKEPYGFVEKDRRKRAEGAIEKGLEVILAAQIEVDGKLTAWCAQHDRDDLSPAKARAYELPSISGGESAGIVKYLMEIDPPSEAVKHAVKSAIKWFDKVRIEGIKVVRQADESLPRGYDNVVVEDPGASPVWARFYEIGTNRPMFVGRDGIVKYNLSEIEHERRVGYSYLGNYAGKLLEKNYQEWKERWCDSK